MNGRPGVFAGAGGSGMYGNILGQLQGNQGMPGNINYLMQLLQMMPQGGQQGGQQGNYGPQLPRADTSAMSMYGGQNPYLQDMLKKEEAAQRLAGIMSGAYSGMAGDTSYLNQSNYFGLLQSLLGVSPIPFGR